MNAAICNSIVRVPRHETLAYVRIQLGRILATHNTTHRLYLLIRESHRRHFGRMLERCAWWFRPKWSYALSQDRVQTHVHFEAHHWQHHFQTHGRSVRPAGAQVMHHRQGLSVAFAPADLPPLSGAVSIKTFAACLQRRHRALERHVVSGHLPDVVIVARKLREELSDCRSQL